MSQIARNLTDAEQGTLTGKRYLIHDRDPPFTAKQLDALATPDFFEVIDWPGLFGVTPTPLKRALADTYQHPVYSKIVLEF